MTLRDLRKGDRFRWLGVLFELIDESPVELHDGAEGRRVAYMEPDAFGDEHGNPRWQMYAGGLMEADAKVSRRDVSRGQRRRR